jgi:membrane protein
MLHGVSIKQFFRDLSHEIGEDDVAMGAAALAFYLMLAIFPALILTMSIIPYLPIDRIDEAIMDLLGQALPDDAYEMVEGVVVDVTSERRGGLLSFGLLATLWAASSGMLAVMRQLNKTYRVKEARGFIRARGTAIILSLVFILLIIGAFALIVLGGVIEAWLQSRFGLGDAILMFFAAFRWVVIFLAMMLAFSMIYRYAPNVEQKFAFITPGSVVGVLLLVLASLAFSLYTANFADYDATYGSIGAVIVLMMWLYITGLVILIGSEINALLEHYSARGKRKGEKHEAHHPGGALARD